MKKIVFNIIISLLFVSCIHTTDMITIIDCDIEGNKAGANSLLTGIEAKPAFDGIINPAFEKAHSWAVCQPHVESTYYNSRNLPTTVPTEISYERISVSNSSWMFSKRHSILRINW